MTVEAIARKAGPYQYTAGASYPFYYKVFSAEDVAVYVVQDSSEVQLTEDQYTVNLNDDQDNNPGGTVAVSVICESITIVSDVDYTQETVITNRGGFYPNVLNKIHDKLTILIQQILTTLNRTVKIKVTDATSDPDKILDDLRTTASAAAESAQASADSAATAIATANTAVSKSETAITTADTANATATQALSSIPSTVAETVNTTISGMDIPRLVSDDVDNKIDSLNLDEKIASEVKDAIAGTEIPGLTPETIAGALGYVPYDAETNSQDFATSTEVAEAISEIPNADWNATEGAAEIKNKPELSAVATSGNYADLQNKPVAMTGATAEAAGTSGFVPAPSAGDENKVLKGDGTWVEKADVDLTNLSSEGKKAVSSIMSVTPVYTEISLTWQVGTTQEPNVGLLTFHPAYDCYVEFCGRLITNGMIGVYNNTVGMHSSGYPTWAGDDALVVTGIYARRGDELIAYVSDTTHLTGKDTYIRVFKLNNGE